MSRRANYALCEFQQHLGPAADSLDVPWAEYTGNSTDPVSFNIPTSSSADPYVEMQVFDVEDSTTKRGTANRCQGSVSRPTRGGSSGWIRLRPSDSTSARTRFSSGGTPTRRTLSSSGRLRSTGLSPSNEYINRSTLFW